MIVFYVDNKKVTPIVSLNNEKTICDSICSSNCIKPKGKCCNKYLKKGINCKRCPLTFDLKAVS